MKRFLFITSSIITFSISFFSIWIIYYHMSLMPVSKKSKIVNFSVEQGSNFYSISKKLSKDNLIKSKFTYKMYIKLHKPSKIKAGVYQLNKNMGVNEIVKTLSGDIHDDLDTVKITFTEGKNMHYIMKQISLNTNNSEDDVLKTLKSEKYLKKLSEKYWFIGDEILNEDIYYSLEGYLYPNTYNFKKETSVKSIFDVMLEQMNQKLTPYKKQIEKSGYTPHQILTLASIVELEGINNEDRKSIAGVLYNRISKNMNLGSDVTSYYGALVDLNERDLTQNELNDTNKYNTRNNDMLGQLPIGPICNPSVDSIEAVLNPTDSEFYFFVADKDGKTYFTKTKEEHEAKINELKEANLWHVYE